MRSKGITRPNARLNRLIALFWSTFAWRGLPFPGSKNVQRDKPIVIIADSSFWLHNEHMSHPEFVERTNLIVNCIMYAPTISIPLTMLGNQEELCHTAISGRLTALQRFLPLLLVSAWRSQIHGLLSNSECTLHSNSAS